MRKLLIISFLICISLVINSPIVTEKNEDLNQSLNSENLMVDATLFQKYQINFNKNYKTEELFERFQTFEKNVHKIIKFNTDSIYVFGGSSNS